MTLPQRPHFPLATTLPTTRRPPGGSGAWRGSHCAARGAASLLRAVSASGSKGFVSLSIIAPEGLSRSATGGVEAPARTFYPGCPPVGQDLSPAPLLMELWTAPPKAGSHLSYPPELKPPLPVLPPPYACG